MEEQKPMHRSLLTPGLEDRSPFPPVGQLQFGKIADMNEEVLNRALRERHGLTNIFKEGTRNPPYTEGNLGARRVEIKRAALARLEGYSTHESEELIRAEGSSAGSGGLLASTLERVLNPECKERIHDVNRSVAREALLHRPSAELAELEEKIKGELSKLGLPELSLPEILNVDNLPPHRGELWERALKGFYLQLTGLSETETAEALGMEVGSFSGFKSARLSKVAINVIRTLRGFKKFK